MPRHRRSDDRPPLGRYWFRYRKACQPPTPAPKVTPTLTAKEADALGRAVLVTRGLEDQSILEGLDDILDAAYGKIVPCE
jgi:hypothetical protein